ncbi:hypothetical protein ABKV19_027210 [Rosa sericea]
MMMSSGRITLPKGFRFQPSDEELLSHYLEKKIQRKDPQIEAIIPEIDVCKHEPRDLPALVFTRAEFLERKWFTMADSPDMQWYFSPRVFKHSKSKSTRSNRTTRWPSRGEPSSGSCSMAFNVENQAFKQLGNVLLISVEGQPDSYNSSNSDMVEELLDEPGNLDLLFNQPPPPQLQSPIKLGNVSHTTNVHIDECRKRKYQFGDNDPSPTKKNHISTNDVDELISNTASNSENHAVDAIPKEYSQPGENLGSDSFQSLEPLSINREPRDCSHHINFIRWDDLPPLIEGFDSSLAKFSDTVIDGGSSDRNTKVVYGSVLWSKRS